jgi:hypothetical protein
VRQAMHGIETFMASVTNQKFGWMSRPAGPANVYFERRSEYVEQENCDKHGADICSLVYLEFCRGRQR